MGRNNPTVIFTEPKKVTIEDRPFPSAGDNGLLVQTTRTLISTGTELTILNGEFPKDSAWASYGKFPFVPGYDNIGVVVDVGKNVDKSWIGRKVGSYASHSAYVVISPDHARIVPDKVLDDDASFFTLAEIVMNGVRRGEVTWGDSVVIYGAGLLGQLASRFCRIAGARPVICVDVSDKRLELLTNDVKIINSKNENPAEAVSKMTNGRMADVVIEVTGNPDAIPQEFKVLKRQGKIVILSSPRGTTANFDFHDLCNSPSYTIIGAHNSSHPHFETPYNQWTQKRHSELFFNLLADGELDMKPLISHIGSYTEAVKFYQILLEDRTQAMGVVMQWS